MWSILNFEIHKNAYTLIVSNSKSLPEFWLFVQRKYRHQSQLSILDRQSLKRKQHRLAINEYFYYVSRHDVYH